MHSLVGIVPAHPRGLIEDCHLLPLQECFSYFVGLSLGRISSVVPSAVVLMVVCLLGHVGLNLGRVSVC